MNTIAATTNRIPRVGLIALVALGAAFAVFMVTRLGVLGGSADQALPAPTTPRAHAHGARPTGTSRPASPTKPTVVLLPGLPAPIAAKLRNSNVVVVSVYVAPSAGDRASVVQARNGARAAGAAYAAINVANDKNAAAMASFVGPVSAPTLLVSRRPGTIVTQIPGSVEAAVVAQAARNAGARRG